MPLLPVAPAAPCGAASPPSSNSLAALSLDAAEGWDGYTTMNCSFLGLGLMRPLPGGTYGGEKVHSMANIDYCEHRVRVGMRMEGASRTTTRKPFEAEAEAAARSEMQKNWWCT